MPLDQPDSRASVAAPSADAPAPADVRRLLALLDHSYDAMILRRLSGEVLYWNGGAERTYGWASSEAVGQSTHLLLDTGFPQPRVVIEQALAENGRWEGRLVHTSRAGARLTVESRWTLEGRGEDATVLEINRDITPRLHAQEQARARERQLWFVTDNAPVAIAHCDPETRFKFVNRPYAARFGLHPSQLIGRPIAQIIGERAFAAIAPYVARVLQGEHVEVEIEIPYEAFGPQHMHFAYEPERDDGGRVIGFVAAIVNVTERRRAEEALREADRRKDLFLATLAHELRNPLAALQNAAALLGGRSDAPTVQRPMAILNRQLGQLVRLVDDLLDVSRISRGQLQLRTSRVELAEIVRSAVESAALASAPSAHVLEVEVPEQPVFFDADPHRLSQVLANLLNNAAKYTPSGGRITLAARASEDEVVVSVSDTGIGIPPDMLERVFEMFTQVDRSLEHAQGGLGIGLTLVRVLVEMHGGSVQASSAGEDRGSTFVVRLPRGVRQANPVAAPRGESGGPPARPKRVLVADDNLDAAESLQLWLQMAGHEAFVAADGPTALSSAESLKPDVVLLDLGMPGMSGYEVARHIRATDWGAAMVLVALTGWGQDEDRRRTREAGFDHHLTKPVPPDEIEDLVRRC